MSDTEERELGGETEGGTGLHDEMVAPLRVSEKSVPRRIASRLTKRPVYSGDPADWKTFSHRARAFFDEVHIEATMLRNDARKTSDDADDVAQWSDDNALGFNLLQGMIDDKTAKGRILLMKIIEEFPGVAERKGDELWKWMEETVTGISMEQVDELKRDIRRVKLLENETADQWEEKIMNLKNMFSRLPERFTGSDQTLLCRVMMRKLPSRLSTYKLMVKAMSTVDESIMKDSTKLMDKLVNMHRDFKSGNRAAEEEEGGRAYLTANKPGGRAFKFTGSCWICGQTGHRKKDCTRTCKAKIGSFECGLQCCGGVKSAEKCMVLTGIPPNAKLPPYIVAKIEKRAAEAKRGGGKAMCAFGDDTDEEDDDDDFGAIFVACQTDSESGGEDDGDGVKFSIVAQCVVGEGDEEHVMDDGEVEEPYDYGAAKNAIAETPISAVQQNDDFIACGNSIESENFEQNLCRAIVVYTPRDVFDVRGAFAQAPPSAVSVARVPREVARYLDLNSSEDESEDEDDCKRTKWEAIYSAEHDLEMQAQREWRMGKRNDEEAEVLAAEDAAYALMVDMSDLSTASMVASDTSSSASSEGVFQSRIRIAANETIDGEVVVEAHVLDGVHKAVSIICDEEDNNNGMTAEERGKFGYASHMSLELGRVLRELATHTGKQRVEKGTLLALRAVIAKEYFSDIYRTDKDAWSAHNASARNFAYWKQTLKGFKAYRCCAIPKTSAARKELSLKPVPSFARTAATCTASAGLFGAELIVAEGAMQRFATELDTIEKMTPLPRQPLRPVAKVLPPPESVAIAQRPLPPPATTVLTNADGSRRDGYAWATIDEFDKAVEDATIEKSKLSAGGGTSGPTPAVEGEVMRKGEHAPARS